VFVAIARVVLRIPGAQSLKDRRQVVRSYKDRVRVRLGISIAEVGDVENYQVATLGLAAVGRDARTADELVSQAISLGEQLKGGLVVDVRREALPLGQAGGELPPFAGAETKRMSFDEGDVDVDDSEWDDDTEPNAQLDEDPDFDRWKRR
jgi:uncharacterized protein YlxP (DUF503 family)